MGYEQLHDALLPAAFTAFTAKVRAVPADRWDSPTPCTEWSVRDLVNHMISEHLWAPHLLRGETLEEVGDRYDGDVAGDDPVGAWEEACGPSMAAWRAAVDSEQLVHVTGGEITVGEYAVEMHADLVVHGWDLARGAGLDEAVDAAAAEHILEVYGDRDLSGSAMFAAPIEIETSDPGQRMIARFGRDPR